ncbi:MAG: HDOD domain-containing protein [Desulfobacterales bacterium]
MALLGSVDDSSLAGMLWQIFAQGKTGVLEASQGERAVKVFVKHGAVIHAVGFQKEALLGYLLKNNNLISAEELKRSLQAAQERKIALGKVLLDENIINLPVLSEIIRRQAEMILDHLYAWEQGEYEFRFSKINEANIVPVKLSLMDLAVAAARKVEDGMLFARFIGDLGVVLKARQISKDFSLALSDFELQIMGHIDGRKSLAEVMAAGGFEAGEFYRSLFILILGGRLVSIFDETGEESPDPQDKIAGEYSDSDLKRQIMESLNELPPLLNTAMRAQQILADPKAGFKEVSSLIEEDQAMAVRILKAANSAYYGLVGQVSSVQHASVVLGYKTLSEIITAASASDYLVKTLEGYDQNAEALWRHSLAVALGGKLLAGKRRPKLEGDAFTVGLFHDIGKVVLDPYIAERKEAFLEARRQNGDDSTEAERQLFGFDHAELAADLCRQWNIPDTLGSAIKYHHFPEETQNNDLAHILHVADCWAHKLEREDAGVDDDPMANVQEATYIALGLDEAGLVGVMAEVGESWKSLAESM